MSELNACALVETLVHRPLSPQQHSVLRVRIRVEGKCRALELSCRHRDELTLTPASFMAAYREVLSGSEISERQPALTSHQLHGSGAQVIVDGVSVQALELAARKPLFSSTVKATARADVWAFELACSDVH